VGSAGEPLPELHLRLCPSCAGRPIEVGTCSECEGAGILDHNGRPFYPPPPFDTWEPVQIVALDEAHRQRQRRGPDAEPLPTVRRYRMSRSPRGEEVAVEERPRRLTMSQIVELLLTRSPADHSTIRLSRNAKGDTQVDVSIRTGEPGLETVEQARAKAEETYEHLCKLYPMREVD
jgi:hypothetical protein